MKNVTVSLAEDLAQWARVEAAKAGKSLSRWLSDVIERERTASNDQAAAVEAFLSQAPRIRLAEGERLPTKEEIYAERLSGHERAGLHASRVRGSQVRGVQGMAEDGGEYKWRDD